MGQCLVTWGGGVRGNDKISVVHHFECHVFSITVSFITTVPKPLHLKKYIYFYLSINCITDFINYCLYAALRTLLKCFTIS